MFILIRNSKPILLSGFFNKGCKPSGAVTFYASGNYIGRISKPGQTTSEQNGDFILWPDEHLLEIVLNGASNVSAHTIWAYRLVD